MHRTTTTATLLVTVAVSALSGCTTVPRPPGPEPSAAPSPPAAPAPSVRTEPQIVQAPAQEALGLVGPPRQRERSAPERSTPPATTSAPAAPPAPPARPRPPQRPEPRYSKQPPGVPDIAESTRGEVTRQVPQRRADVCALGRKYGGWRSGSPESTICDETYGR